MNNINSFSMRILKLPDYTSSVFAHVVEEQITADESFLSIVKSISLASDTNIINEDRWLRISNIAESILNNEELWIELSRQNPHRIPHFNSSWQLYRKELIKLFQRINHDKSYLPFQAIKNSLYQSSEGLSLPVNYDISLPSLNWFNETLYSHLLVSIDRKRDYYHIIKDDVISWLRVLNMLQNNPTHRFNKQFKSALEYEIPYGLSPKTKSETLEALIKNSKTIALVPMLSGINSISTALSNGEWLVALKAATTTGAVVLVLISTISLSDRIVNYFKTHKNEQ